MSRYGLLIDYEYCTGCHSCETACKVEKNLPTGKWGIQVKQVGPWEIENNRWQFDYIPIPTDICDLCAERRAQGKLPICVHHCQSMAIEFGPIEELAKKSASKPKTVLYSR
ncbi:MAG: 4Fe-4S binding protein [Bacillota bacterium]